MEAEQRGQLSLSHECFRGIDGTKNAAEGFRVWYLGVGPIRARIGAHAQHGAQKSCVPGAPCSTVTTMVCGLLGSVTETAM